VSNESYLRRTGKDPDHDDDSWHPSELGAYTSEAELLKEWRKAKLNEQAAQQVRRNIEDRLIELYMVDDTKDGSKTYKPEGYKVKVTTRLSRRVDSDALIDLASQAGIGQEHLQALFRWKPEINLREWQNAAPEITGPLAPAITTKPGRPSFSIEKVQPTNDTKGE